MVRNSIAENFHFCFQVHILFPLRRNKLVKVFVRVFCLVIVDVEAGTGSCGFVVAVFHEGHFFHEFPDIKSFVGSFELVGDVLELALHLAVFLEFGVDEFELDDYFVLQVFDVFGAECSVGPFDGSGLRT